MVLFTAHPPLLLPKELSSLQVFTVLNSKCYSPWKSIINEEPISENQWSLLMLYINNSVKSQKLNVYVPKIFTVYLISFLEMPVKAAAKRIDRNTKKERHHEWNLFFVDICKPLRHFLTIIGKVQALLNTHYINLFLK